MVAGGNTGTGTGAATNSGSASVPTTYTIQLRRGTAAEWAAANPVLAAGTPGFESDTGKVKVGDGVKAWSALSYLGTGVGGVGDVTLNGGQTLTNKTIDGATNTLRNLPTSAVKNLVDELKLTHSGNLATNTGFEADSYLGVGVPTLVNFDTAQKRGGTRSVKLIADGTANPMFYLSVAATQASGFTYPVREGEVFYFEIWVYGDAANTATTKQIELCVITLDTAGVQRWQVAGFTPDPATWNGKWTKLSATIPITQVNVQRMSLCVRSNSIPTGNSFWFDDPIVYRVGVPGSAASPAQLTASGSDPDIGLALSSKGTGLVKINGIEAVDVSKPQTLSNKTLARPIVNSPTVNGVNNLLVATFGDRPNAVNRLMFESGETGRPPAIYALGGDTDINLRLIPRNAGLVEIYCPPGQPRVGIVAGASSITSITPIDFIPKGAAGIRIYSDTAGATARVTADGVDPVVDLQLNGKGTTSKVLINAIEAVDVSKPQTLSNKTLVTPVITGMVTINGNPAVSKVAVPATKTAAGLAGQTAADANFIYYCHTDNQWVRAAIDSTW